MRNDDVEENREETNDRAAAPAADEREDVSFFNPWDRRLDADMKSQRNKFEF